MRHFSRKTADLAARNEKDGMFFHLMRLALLLLFPGRAENRLYMFVFGRHRKVCMKDGLGAGYLQRGGELCRAKAPVPVLAIACQPDIFS